MQKAKQQQGEAAGSQSAGCGLREALPPDGQEAQAVAAQCGKEVLERKHEIRL